MEKNKVKLNICGVNYFISTDESVEYTMELGKRIDERMKEILKGGALLSTTQVAVLAALEFSDELAKTEKNLENFRSQIKAYLEDASKAKSERDYYKRELERIKAEARFKEDQLDLFKKSQAEQIAGTAQNKKKNRYAADE